MTKNIVKLFQSPVEFETFGINSLAYVRPVMSDDINAQFPQGPELPEGLDLWALFGADGQPIAVADEKSDLLLNAEELDLLTVGVQ
ncbi:MAG: DUF1150 family protein [Rhizobiaceae bacterium]